MLETIHQSDELALLIDFDRTIPKQVIASDGRPLEKYPVVGGTLRLKQEADWTLELEYGGNQRQTINTRGLLALDYDLATVLTADYWEDSTLRITRRTPSPSPAGSVGAATSDVIASTSSTTNSLTTGSFTPSNAVMILTVTHRTNGAEVVHSFNISDTFSDSITWTKVSENKSTKIGTSVWTGVGWSSGSGTITATTDLNQFESCVIHVETYSGVDSSSPISEQNTGSGTSSTQTVTLGGIATGNRSHGAIGSRQPSGTIAAGSNETQIAETLSGSAGSDSDCSLETQYGDLNQDTSVNWTGLAAVDNSACAVELAASGGGGGFPYSQAVMVA